MKLEISVEFHLCSKHLFIILGVVPTMMVFSTKIDAVAVIIK